MDKLLWIIVIFVFIILVFSVFDKFRVKYNINEGFSTTIKFCPFNSQEFIDKKGNSVCCDGKVEDNICYSKIICTLSNTAEYPLCNEIYNKYIKFQERNMCPPKWKYYENNKEKGCVKGAVKDDNSEPINSNSETCKVYHDIKTANDYNNFIKINYKNKDSCMNVYQLEKFKCLKPDCIKYIDKDGLLYQSYKNNDITITCTDGHRARELLSNDTYNKLKEANQIC